MHTRSVSIRSLIVWLSLGLLLGQCRPDASDPSTKPDNLVDEDKMVQILTEVHLSEARIAKMGINSPDTTALLFGRLQEKTLKKFDVDTSAYTKSFVYYSANPAKLSRIYEQVVEKLKAVEKAKSEKAGHKPVPAQ